MRDERVRTDPAPDGAGGRLRRWRTAAVDRLAAWRNRTIMDERFRARAASFPLTRPVARASARRLFDLCAGFVYSQVLSAVLDLDLLRVVADRPLTAEEIAPRIGLPLPATERLLKAAASLRLIERRGPGRYGLGADGAALIASPGIAAMVAHHRLLYADLADPVSLLRGERRETELGKLWAYATAADPTALGGADVARYCELMAASQAFVAAEILDAYDLGAHRRLLDIGGGEGAFIEAAARRHAALAFTLVDLPPVAERARTRLARAGLEGRATAIGADVFRDPLPQGADVASLVRVLHDHDDSDVLALLTSIRAALPEEGTLLIAEPLAGEDEAGPAADAYFGMYLLAMGRGRPRTVPELEALLHAAGFRHVRRLRTRQPVITGLLVATPWLPLERS